MEINLKKIVANRAKRIGRGPGSGKGSHTVGFGQKGQGSRGKRKALSMSTEKLRSKIISNQKNLFLPELNSEEHFSNLLSRFSSALLYL